MIHSVSTAVRRIGLGTVFVCLAATLTLGLVEKSPCIGGAGFVKSGAVNGLENWTAGGVTRS